MTKMLARVALALALVCGMARAEAPKTVEVLQLTPDNAQVALAIPPLDAALQQTAELVKKFHPNPAEVDAFLNEIIADAAEGAEAWGAQNFKEIAAKRGLNGEAAIGVFCDVSKTVKKATEEYAKNKAAAEKEAADKAKAADVEAAKAAAAAGTAAPAPSKPAAVKVKSPEMTIPDLAAVFTVADKEVAQRGIDELINAVPDLSSATPKDETVGSVTVKVYDEYGYFFAGDKVVIGSIGLVKGVAAKVDKPGTVRYGSKECPAGAESEVVELIYGKRFLPLVSEVLPTLDIAEDVRPQIEAGVKQFAASFDSDDPMVLSLGVHQTGAILQSRIDSAQNKGIKATSGEAAPLRLAQWLPENTLAMVSLRFNPEWKKQIVESILPAVAEARGGDTSQITIAKQVIDQLGDEITIGVAAADQDFPSAFAMVSLAKPDETKGLLQMLVPAMPGEKHGDVDIQQLAVPSPIQFSIAYPGDMILLSNSVDGMKQIIDLQKSKGTTKFLASQNPPFDPATPRFAALLVNAKLLTDVLLPLSTLGVKLPGDAQEIATKVAPLLQDVRLVSEVEGTWHKTALSVNLQADTKSASAK